MSGQLLLDEKPLFVIPSLAVRFGLNEALVLQQLHWALRRDNLLEEDGRRWVRLSLAWWQEQFPFWSESTVKRALQELRDAKVILSQRGREGNVYTIDYGHLDQSGTGQDDLSGGSNRPDETGQDDLAPCKREELREVEIEQPAVEGDGHLPGMAPPPPPEPEPVPSDPFEDEVWAYYVHTFGDRLRVKELTPPRKRTLSKAMKAVGGDADDVEARRRGVALLKAAIDGLKSYRQQHSDRSQDVSIDVIFATGPQDRSNLTEKIEWWASQSAGKADVPSSVPSVHRARVMDLAVQVLKVEHQPDSEAVRERGEQARAILSERFKLRIISDGNGRLLRFEEVTE